jgi:N-acetylgalactosamine-6-sulfatase
MHQRCEKASASRAQRYIKGIMKLNRDVFLLLLVTAWITGLPAAHAGKPLNVVFILADDLGWGDLGAYGDTHGATPRLDAFAKQGTLFTHFYVNNPVCSPSRCGFFTGQYPARHRVHGHYASREMNEQRGMSQWLDPETPNLARALKAAGYTTGHIGKWHLGAQEQDAPVPDRYGFDFVRGVVCSDPAWDEPAATFCSKSSRLFVDEAIRFVQENRERPFYLQLWTLLPHAPLNPSAEQMRPFERFGPPADSWGAVPHKTAETIYRASIADLDAQIGRLLDALDAAGLTDDTLVVFSSDNGPEDIHISKAGHSGVGSPGPFRGRKRSLYEGGIRVPFIVRWPGHVPAGRVDDATIVSGVDLLPTVCSLAKAPIPAGHEPDGVDMSAAFLGRPADRKEPLFWEWRYSIFGDHIHRSPMLAVREGDWKLLCNPDGSRVELYDIRRDPGEADNLRAEHPDVADRLIKDAVAWQKTLPAGPVEPAAGQNAYPWPQSSKLP